MNAPDFFEELRVDPIIRGVREQCTRACLFLELGNRITNKAHGFRLHLAAIYACRALTELMLEAAFHQRLEAFKNPSGKESRLAFETQWLVGLPYYLLIEKIRIHDFHRAGCLPPDPRVNSTCFSGPIKLVANAGGVVVQITDDGPQVHVTGRSKYQEQRALLQRNEEFFDDNSGEYVSLPTILSSFVQGVPCVIEAFGSLLAKQPEGEDSTTESGG